MAKFTVLPPRAEDSSMGSASHPGTFRFSLENVDPTVANAIRRLVLSRVPTVSFHFDTDTAMSDDIRVLANTSSLHNEFIVHRVSLIPLHFTADETQRHVKGGVELSLDVTNDTNESISVTTKDLVVVDGATSKEFPDPGRILPASHVTGDHVVIVRLKPGQRLALSCTPSVGTALEYAGRSAVSLCSYGMAVDEAAADAALESRLSKCRTESERASARADFDVHERARHVLKDDRGRPRKFDFRIESECGISPRWMVSYALRALVADVSRARRDLVRPVPAGAGGDSFQWDISPADHSLGSVLQAWIMDRGGSAGYHCPHPLQRVVRLVVRFGDGASADAATERLAGWMSDLESYLDRINPGWDGSA